MSPLGMLFIAATVSASVPIRLDPEKVVARVLEVSEVVSTADLNVSAAARKVAASDALLLPTVHGSASAFYRSSVPSFSIGIPGMSSLELAPDIREIYAAGVRLDYVVFTGGAVSGARHAARHELDAARHGSAQARADLRLLATCAYWDAVRAEAGVTAAAAHQRRADAVLSDARALKDAGMATEADLAAAHERAASASVQLIRARTAASNATATLRSLMRLDGDEIQLADSLEGALPSVPDSLQELQREAVESRPELGAARSRHHALRASSTVAGAGSWPDIVAIAQWDYSRPNQRYFPTEDEWNDSWSVGVAGSWTIFDRGKARAEARALEAAAMAASRSTAELERVVRLEVETAHNELKSALAAVTAAEAALEAATEWERQARERHVAGVASTADLLDAEAQLSAAERLVIETRSGAWIAAARLDRAVGR